MKIDSSGKWLSLSDNVKYGGLWGTILTITHVDINDAGVYRCSSRDRIVFAEYGSNITVTLPVNGYFGEWTAWNYCSVTCGDGKRFRHRICNNPPPSGGGSICSGATQQAQNCFINGCPVNIINVDKVLRLNGYFGEWREWNHCPVTCGGDQRFRHRTCNNPPPSRGGSICSGANQQAEICSINKCPDILQTTISKEYYVAIKGQDITLECKIKTELPNRDLYWLKGSNMLRSYRIEKYSGGSLSEPSLTIKNIDRNDAGYYTCKLENAFGHSAEVVELKILYNPYVYQSSDTIKVSTGDTVQLKCVHESYPDPSAVFWKRDGERLNVSVSKYNGSTINEPSLTIYNTELLDAGTYVCVVVNEIGTGYSSEIQLKIKEKQPQFAEKVPVIVGTSVAVFFLILCTVIVIIRRHVKKRQESNYETNEMMNAESHAYGKTDTYHEYCNSATQQNTDTNNDTPLLEDHFLLERYKVSGLTKRIGDADLQKAKMREEFMFLESNGSKVDVLINDNDEVVYTNETGASTAESKMLYIKRSADDIFVFSSLPDDGNVEQFWSVIINNRLENIIMIVQKNE
ncbi:uncharacterized protein [Mytilus edulis]|uniref:uncharacterized protein n=1 Tax=Mytilus edulis TaxID=6550 RepID=UPI0039EF8880